MNTISINLFNSQYINKLIFILLLLLKFINNQNNMILVEEKSSKYLNFLTFSNGDMIFEISSNYNGYIDYIYNNYDKIIFYGLKKNGRYFFINSTNSKETPIYSIITPFRYIDQNERGNSIIFVDGTECYLTIGKNIYIFNFKNDDNKYGYIPSSIGYYNDDCRANLIFLNDNNYIFSLNSNTLLIKFKLINNENNNEDIIITEQQSFQVEKKVNQYNIMDCFYNKDSDIIYCLYDYDFDYDYSKGKCLCTYKIDVFSSNLEKLNNVLYTFISYAESSFTAAISFNDGGGAFAYYDKNSNYNIYPKIIFIAYNNIIGNFYNIFSSFDSIILDKYDFNNDKYYNDLIKISNNKIGFFAVKNDLKTLYIIIINFFEYNSYNVEYDIKYYSLELYNSLNRIIFDNIKAHIFNSFIIIGCNYHLEDDYDQYFKSSLMFIGYPNNTDSEFNIIDYLINNELQTIDNLYLDLTKGLTIENNIFEYIYDGIKIQNTKEDGYIFI